MKKINLKILKILIFLSIFVLFSNFAYACWFWCYDSDNGQQYSIKGDIYCEYTLQDSDSCIGDYIKEYYCDGKTIKAVIQSCSDFDFYGDWSDPYCDGNVLKRKRPFYDYYCSDGACKSRTTYDYELIETCQYGCDNGRCNPSPSCDRTDTSCGNYPNCQNCNNKDDWYDVGSPYSCCNGDNTGTCTCQKIEYRDYYCSGTSCSYTVTGTTTKYSNCNLCGTKDCDNLNYYYQTGTESPTSIETCYYRDYQDCTKKCSSGSCHDCSCTSFQNKEQYQCGICKYISPSSCDGSTKGSCSNYPKGTSCGTNKECDGNGNCITIPVCGDGKCNGNEDKWSCPQDCGEPCAANQCKEESEKKCYNIGEITPDGKGYCAGHITAWWVYCPEAGSCNQQGNPLIGIPYSYCTNDDNDWRWRQCDYGCDNGKCINCQDECDPAFYPKCDGNDTLQCVTDPITGCLVITRSTCKCGCDPYLKACIPESQPKWKCEGKKKVHYDECGNKDQEITCSYECKDGECISDPCEGKPTCDSPGTERCNGNIHEICEQDEQGCRVWKKVEDCPLGCRGDGFCNECWPPGDKQCKGNKLQECQQSNFGNYKWHTTEICEFGCQNNACFSCDIDYCSSHSDVCCNREEVCKQDDICNINCLDYKDPDCGPDCTDECSLGEKQCNGNYLEECGDYDEDECLEFGNPQYCEHGCSNNACNSPPSNPGEVIFRDAVWDNDKLTLNQHTWSNIPEKSFYAYQPKEDTQLNYCDRDEEECRPLWKIYMKEMGVDGELGWYRSCNQHGKCKRGICADDLDCEGTNKCIECNGGDYLYTDENGCKHYDTREYKTGWKCVLDTSDGGHPIVFWCMCNGNEVSVGSWCDNDDGETYNTKWVYTTEQISGEEDCGGLDCGAVLESYGFNYESGCDCCHYPNEFNYRQYYKEKLSTEDMNALFKHTRCWIRGEQVRYNGNDFIINYSVEGIPIVHNNHLACLIRYQDWQEQVKDDNGNVANQIGPDSKVLFNFSVIPKVCNPDDKICKGNELMQCNLDGTDFELIEECAFGCENGECLSNPGINNTAPILEAIPPINITEGELIRLIVKATDAENDTLLFKIGYTNITAAANITQIPVICDAIGIRSEGWYDANSNELIEYDFCKGKQASLFEYQTKQGDAGNYTVIITASDGELEDSQEVFIVINKAPVCFPYWQCSDWSSCSNGKQTRTCIDVNDCNTTEGKPSELRTCTVQKKSGGGGGGGSSRRKNKTTTANILKEQNHEKITSTTPKPKNTLSTTSSLPSETELTTKLGETIKFSSRNSNADSYKWYVDDALVSESSSFDYTAQKPGKHKILLVVKGKGVQISRKWTVEVLETNTKGDAVKTTKTATKTEAREDTTSFYGNTSIITKIFNFFKKIFLYLK